MNKRDPEVKVIKYIQYWDVPNQGRKLCKGSYSYWNQHIGPYNNTCFLCNKMSRR